MHSTSYAVHHVWRVSLFDSARARSYAIDAGYVPDQWFLGPSAAVAFSRSDREAGRPNTFRVLAKQLKGLRSSGTNLGLGTYLASDEHVHVSISEAEFSLITKADGAVLSVQLTPTVPERQLSSTTILRQEGTSCLQSQTLRLEMYLGDRGIAVATCYYTQAPSLLQAPSILQL